MAGQILGSSPRKAMTKEASVNRFMLAPTSKGSQFVTDRDSMNPFSQESER